MPPRTHTVNARARAPLLTFITTALEQSGARILSVGPSNEAPFRIVFETNAGERVGIVVYAFFANRVPTRNRPLDEGRFQLKYGSKDGQLHELWQDPDGLFTTLLIGIDPESGVWIAADPVLHSPTRMFISVEIKERHVQRALETGWDSWERSRRAGADGPIETMIAGTSATFLDLIRFERAGLGLSPGHRGLLASDRRLIQSVPVRGSSESVGSTQTDLHELERAFNMSRVGILDLISRAPRLRMAVRGWVAEEHLFQYLGTVNGVTDLQRLEADGQPDLSLRLHGGTPITIECKNTLRHVTAAGHPRLDFQRTRASIADRCSRYYRPDDFDLVAACLHPVTLTWEFRFQSTKRMSPHRQCEGRLASNVAVENWATELSDALGGS